MVALGIIKVWGDFLIAAGVWMLIVPIGILMGVGFFELTVPERIVEFYLYQVMLDKRVITGEIVNVVWWIRGFLAFLGVIEASSKYISFSNDAESFNHQVGRFAEGGEATRLEKEVPKQAIRVALWQTFVPSVVVVNGFACAIYLAETSGEQAVAYIIGSIILATLINYMAQADPRLRRFLIVLKQAQYERRNRAEYHDMTRFIERFMSHNGSREKGGKLSRRNRKRPW